MIDLIGERFGLLTVVSEAPMAGNRRMFNCVCKCDNTVATRMDALRGGNSKSCGCMIGVTHGLSDTPEYECWAAMKVRCYKPNNSNYYKYGAKGITVCDEWRSSFLAFYDYIGPRPTVKHSIDRINSKGNYEPGNVRWSTIEEQNQNKGLDSRNRTGITGIRWIKEARVWRAIINANGKRYDLGSYRDFFEACCIRKSAEQKYWVKL